MDPRVSAVDNFTQTIHHDPSGTSIDPTKVKLPSTYIVCIIGASRGIGASIAHSYAIAGASGIIISSRQLSPLEEVAASIRSASPKCRIEPIECDVISSASVASLAEAVRSKFGRLDVLVMSSGYAGLRILRMDQGNPEDVQQAFDINAMGTYLAAHFFVPLLLETEDGAKAFISVGSLAAHATSGPLASMGYCVSKMAAARIVEFAAAQFKDEGLVAVSVHPGAVKTDMSGQLPEEFARCELKLFLHRCAVRERVVVLMSCDWIAVLVDSLDLCGAFCVWLTKEKRGRQWLSGRFLSAKWDVDELLAKRSEIVEKDLLKFVAMS